MTSMGEPARPREDDPSPNNIDDRRIIVALEANIIEADTIQGSEISEQRMRNHKMWSMDRLGNEKRNRSQHISGDVLDAVESQKSYYLETFESSGQQLRFKPEHRNDKTAHLAAKYVEAQFYEKNDGYDIIRDALHDAMVAKRCVVMVDWADEPEFEYRELAPLVPQQLLALEQMPDVQVLEWWEDEQGLGASIRRKLSDGYVKTQLMQPERYYRDPNVAYVKDGAFAGYQEDLSRAEMIGRGYQEDEVMRLKLDYRFRQNEEDSARKAHDSTWSRARRHKRPKEQEVVTVYTTYAVFDLRKFQSGSPTNFGVQAWSDQTRLYKFVWSHGELLTQPNGEKWTEADEYPFIEWTQYKISHAEYGLCEADVNNDIQWTKSNLMRLLIDNNAMVNTSRYVGRKGAIVNPRELLDNNIGSTIWLKTQAGVPLDMDLKPLPTPPVSPISFALVEELNKDKENRSGMSRLAKGLNADAVSNQNADDMIQRLTNASNRRVMRGVRDFAKSFLAPLYTQIYNLGVRYDKRQHMVEVAGEWVELNPSQWPMRHKCYVATALTPEEREEQARFLVNLDIKMSQDPSMAPLYGLEQKHALWDDVCEMMNIEDTSRYMLQPDDPRVQQQLMAQAQQAQQMQVMQQKMAAMQAELMKSRDEREWMKAQMDGYVAQAKIADYAADNARADDQLEHDKVMDIREWQIERDQKRPANL